MRNIYYFLFALVIFASSCQTKSDSDKNTEVDEQTQETKAPAPDLPAPGEFAAKLQATGADYLDILPNNPGNTQQYLDASVEKSAVNLGVYVADLAYTTAYGETETSKEMLSAIVELSSHLGIERQLMEKVVEGYTSNLEEPDSLIKYLRKINSTAYNSLITSGNDRLAAIAYAGFYIERLNIALGVISSYPEDFPNDLRQQLLVPVYHAVLSQKVNIGEIKAYLEANIEGVQETPYYNDLTNMEKLYSEIDYNKILNSQDLTIIETDDNIIKLALKIREMRIRIIE
jgi:hypothetical protein